MHKLAATDANREPYQIIFQEPAFNLNDVAFIESLGHMVVEAPKGSDFIDCNTLFYGPHLYYQLYAEALQGQLPVVYVGSGIDSWELKYVFPSSSFLPLFLSLLSLVCFKDLLC